MSRTRSRVLLILLVLILVLASALFGVLTYWLDTEVPPKSTPDPGTKLPAGERLGGSTERVSFPVRAESI